MPRVAIGIPTYNRSDRLRRCIESALTQTYPHLDIIISDNASPDDTEAVCRAYAARDARITYHRQEENVGAARNFQTVLERSRAPLYMWLADDDWLPPDYVARCVAVLETNPSVVLAGPRARYLGAAGEPTGRVVNCLAQSALVRVLDYYRQVDDNALFYGVMRSACAKRVDVVNWIGSDWLFLAALAYQGHLQTVDGLFIHRERGGASQDYRRLVASQGVPAWQGRVPVTVSLMINTAADMLRNGAYAQAGWAWRALLVLLLPAWIAFWKPGQEILRRLRRRQGT